jgi:MFS transporter, DHA3 family, macrolide efflux protein
MSAIALRWLRVGNPAYRELGSGVETASAVPLLNRNFLLLWQAQGVSQFGDQAFAIAIAFWAMEATRSATMTGLILMASALPVVLLGPITGAFADTRRSRLHILITCDLVSAALVLALALGFVTLTPSWRFALLFVVALLMGVSGAFFEPAVDALVPDLIACDQLERANALRQSSRQVVALTARGLGGILYALVGPAVLFVLDGLSFVFAAGTQLFILPPVVADKSASEPRAAQGVRLFSQAADGFRYVSGQRGMLRFLVCAAIFNALLMPITVLLPAFVTDYLHADVRWYGFILATISAGAMSGCVAVASRHWSGSIRRTMLVLSFGMLAVLLALLGQVTSPWVALAVVFATGAASGIVNVLVMSILQRRAPIEFRGRVIGLHATMTRALVPMAMVGGGAIADLTGRNVPLVYGVCGALALAAAVVLASQRSTRDFLATP